jgi:hypothetical protein
MRTIVFLSILIWVNRMAVAKEHSYQSGTLLAMNSVSCGVDENGGKSFTGEVLGTDSGHKKTHEVLCPEYLLQTNHMTYRIRPRDDKHPAILPIGEKAQFRLDKDKMKLRVEDLDGKERDYTVVSITNRSTNDSSNTSLVDEK